MTRVCTAITVAALVATTTLAATTKAATTSAAATTQAAVTSASVPTTKAAMTSAAATTKAAMTSAAATTEAAVTSAAATTEATVTTQAAAQTKPADSTRAESRPAGTKPAVQSKPAEWTRPESRPASKPAEWTRPESRPASKPADWTRPAMPSKPADWTRPETRPAGWTKPAGTRPADWTRPETRPAHHGSGSGSGHHETRPDSRPADWTRPADKTRPAGWTKPADRTRPADWTKPAMPTRPSDWTKPSGTRPSATRPACDVTLSAAIRRGEYTYRQNQWVRVMPSIRYNSCGSRKPVTVQWTVTNDKTGKAHEFTARSLSFSPQKLGMPVGEYSVKALVASGDYTAHAKTSLKIVAPRVAVEILGGDRTVSANAAVVVSAVSQGAAADAKVTWTCAKADGSSCGSAFGDLSQATGNTLKAPKTVAPGEYVLTATVGETKQAVTITVADKKVDKVALFVPRQSVVLGSGARLYAAAPKDAKVTWTIAGLTIKSTDRNLVLTADQVKAAAKKAVGGKIVVSAVSGTGKARASFTVVSPIQGACAVTADAAIVAGTTDITVTATGFNQGLVPVETAYKFGYLSGDRFVALSDDYSEDASLTATAPMVRGLTAAANVKFAVQVSVDGQKKMGYAVCDAQVSPAKSAAAVTLKAEAALATAQETQNSAEVVRQARIIAVAAKADKKSTAAEKKAKIVAIRAAVAAVRQTASAENAESMSATERANTVEVLAALVAENTAATTDATEATDLTAALEVVLSAKAARGNQLNATESGADVLRIIAQAAKAKKAATKAERQEERDLTRKLAILAAAGIEINQNSTITAEGKKLIARKLLKSEAMETKFGGQRANITLPATVFSEGAAKDNVDEFASVAVTVTEFTVNPVPEVAGEKIEGVAEIDVLVNDEKREIAGLKSKIDLEIAVNQTAGRKYECVYYNEQTEKWSTEGVETVPAAADSKVVKCRTEHLSAFALRSAAPAAGKSAPKLPFDATLLVVAVGVAVAAVAVVAAVIVVNRKQSAARDALETADDDKALLQMPTRGAESV